MTHLLDGPAAGKRLMLKAAAGLLRVTINNKGDIDGLDQPGDAPRSDETIYVYELIAHHGTSHVQMAKPGGGRTGGWYPICDYRLYAEQPADEIMRNNRKWNEWRLPRTPEKYLPNQR